MAVAIDDYEARVLGLLESLLEGRLRALVASGGPLPDPRELAEAMISAVPDAPGPISYTDVVGSFYSSSGVMRLLGIPTKQALDDRRRRATVLAARTVDDVWVYPAFQFDVKMRRVRPGVAAALAELKAAPRWGSVLWLVTPHPDLGGRAPNDVVDDVSSREVVLGLAQEYASSVAQ